MKKKFLSLFTALSVLIAMTAPSFAYEAFKGPLGVLQSKHGLSDGYVLIVPYQGKTSFLIDNDGNIINKWVSAHDGFYGVLLPNGNLVRHATPAGAWPNSGFGGGCGILEEFDWSGKKVWEYKMYEPGKFISHHTFSVMPNGNYLLLGWEYKSLKEAVGKGLDLNASGMPPGLGGRTNSDEGLTAPDGSVVKGIWPDFIREVNRDGKTVWEWHVWDHLGTGAADKIDINVFLPPHFSRFYAGPDWTHFNGLEYNPRTNEICVTSRNLGEVFVINKASGKITFRWGNPANYGQGRWPGGYSDDGDQKLFGPHAPQWTIDNNITILDNGNKAPSGPYTRAVEVSPKTGELVWEWKAPQVGAAQGFYSAFQSGAQKLPNGNWLITSTDFGHVLEVLPTKEIVWEFVNPVAPDNNIYHTSSSHGGGGSIHKALRYGKDFAGFQNKEMKPIGKMPNWVEAMSMNPVPAAPMPK